MNNNYPDYFGKDTKIFIYKCTNCGFEDPVPDWLISESLGFKRFFKKKNRTPKFQCPRCNKLMIPKDDFKK